MNVTIALALGAVVALAADGIPAAGQVGVTGLSGAIHCDAPQCTIPVTVKRIAPSQRCVVTVSSQVQVTGAVQTIVWRISSADFRFNGPSGVTIHNDAGDFELLASASGREFKLKFKGQGHSRTYEYALSVVSAGDNTACEGPAVGPQFVPRIKNQ